MFGISLVKVQIRSFFNFFLCKAIINNTCEQSNNTDKIGGMKIVSRFVNLTKHVKNQTT